MGIFTQNIQQLERSLTNEQKKRAYKKEKIRQLEIFLYNKFYNKFYTNKEQNPDFTLGYFSNPDTKQKLLNYTGFLDDIDKIQIYNKILNNIYNDFKKYYKLEIDISKLKPEEEEQPKEKNNNNKTINNIIDIFLTGLIGLLIPTNTNAKRYRKYKL